MQNIVQYYLHKFYEPSFYLRQYEQDLKEDPQETSYTETAKRIALISAPILSLYQPFGGALSVTMGSARILSSGAAAVNASNLSDCASQVSQTALAIFALSAALYNFTLGLYLTTCVDLFGNLTHVLQALQTQEYDRACEEILLALTSTLYLVIMMTGSLELTLASICIQVLISFYQAKEEWDKGRMPEAFAKMLMGSIRIYQANLQLQSIQKRNFFLKKYSELIDRIEKGREIDHLWDHPLLQDTIPATFEDDKGNVYDFGSYFHGCGKQLVKGMNLHVRRENGKTTLDFKINHVFKQRLESIIKNLEKTPSDDLTDLCKLFGSHIKEITMTETAIPDQFLGTFNKTYEIHLEGLGKISMGALRENLTLYDKVAIEMDSGKNLYDFHEALSFFNLDDALRYSAFEDIEKMKMGFLFRLYSPKQATLFERSDQFFNLPLDAFKEAIFSLSPQMKEIFNENLFKLELRDVMGGKKRLALTGLGDELKAKGARGLVAAITGAWNSNEELHTRIASILKMGMISSEARRDNHIQKKGLSWGADFFTGGADSVFVQMVTDSQSSYAESTYHSGVKLLFNTQALESGTYQYHKDSFGTRIMSDNGWWLGNRYLKRPDIFSFLKKERQYHHWDNEVMIKDRIPPEFITGISVTNESLKQGLLEYLRKSGLVTKNAQGQEEIFSRLVDTFIHVGNAIKDEHFVY